MASALAKLGKRLGFSGKTRASSLPGELCRHFSLDEIKTATNNFNEELIVGVGGFGNVYKGFIDEGNSWPVAIKRLGPSSFQGRGEFRTETLLLCQIRHVHLIPLIGYCNDEGEMILVYEFMANNTLRDHLYDTDKAPLLWKQRLQICIGAARGLHYLHTGLKHTVIHRDVKPTNILLDDKWVAKVSDFGLSKQVLNYDIKFSNLVVDDEVASGPLDVGLSEQIPSSTTANYNVLSGKRVPLDLDNIAVSTRVMGTYGYADPEYIRSVQLTEKSDVYAFGVVLLEVFSARKPFNYETEDKERRNLVDWARKCNEKGSIGEIIDPYLKGKIAPECFKVYVEIAMTCVQDQGIQRPTMVDVMEKLELALELQEKADAERPGRTTYSVIMEDKENYSQGRRQIDSFGDLSTTSRTRRPSRYRKAFPVILGAQRDEVGL